MYKEALRPVWVEINLKNLRYNFDSIRKRVGPEIEIIGVVKADAYGHGAVQVAKELHSCGIKKFAIATLQEAITLRNAGLQEEIILLSILPEMYASSVIDYNLTPVVCSYENARAISEAALAAGTIVSGLIVADTGMGRIGYMTASDENIEYAVSDIKKISKLDGFKIKGLFSHMSTADEVDKSYCYEQEQRYEKLKNALQESNIPLEIKTLASSAATIDLSDAHYNAVRPGIILYGLYPSGQVDKTSLDIKPVMSVKANIVHLKDIPVGFSVGYGRKFIAERPSKIATINLGYADGISRPYSKEGLVIVGGHFAPIAGNICMDQLMIDVTDIPNVSLGDEVILLGSDGNLTITAEEIAAKLNTINYEIICAFGQRLPKIFIK